MREPVSSWVGISVSSSFVTVVLPSADVSFTDEDCFSSFQFVSEGVFAPNFSKQMNELLFVLIIGEKGLPVCGSFGTVSFQDDLLCTPSSFSLHGLDR